VAVNLHDFGEEFMQDLVVDSGETFDIGLYNDSTDALSESSDISDISTEPTGSNYSRQSESASNVTVDLSGSDAKTDFPTQTFDTSDSSQTVDSYFVVVNFNSDEAGDSSQNDHIFQTGSLSQSRNLSEIDTLDVDNVGGTLS
jgi:hypothetical protein